jgi:uncharacterized membrane protein
MEKLLKAGRAFYGIGIIGIGIQQFIYSEFRPVLLAFWPSWLPNMQIWAYVAGGILIVAGGIIAVLNQARTIALILGGFFFLLFICSHVYYQVFLTPYEFHLGSWTDALKELTLSGGALIMASSYPAEYAIVSNKLYRTLGRIFFSVLLISFGVDHFLYLEFVAPLVPGWIPGHIFWTYFGGIALIGSGVCILFQIKIQLVSILLGIMLFIWFVILHIPRAIADPNGAKGNELTSVFEALAFSGIAFVIAWIYYNKTTRKVLTI